MMPWQRFWRQPQQVWLRRAFFQIHLWLGIAIGLYIVMLSVTGSALVYRIELDRFFSTKRPAFVPGKPALPKEQLQASAERLYPGWTGDARRRAHQPAQSQPRALAGEGWSEEGTPVQSLHCRGSWRRGDARRAGRHVAGAAARRAAVRSRRQDLERHRQHRLYGARVDRCGRVVAGHQPMAPFTRRQPARRMEALQLGPAQRTGLLAVSVHGRVGRVRNLSRHSRAVCEFHRRGVGSRYRVWQALGRHPLRLAGQAALRTLAQRAAQSPVGDRRARAGDHVRDRHNHVVAASGAAEVAEGWRRSPAYR